MSVVYHIIIPFLVAMLATSWIHPKILRISFIKNLVDNPDARKLQRRPVPVMGGIAVFFGMIIGICSSQIAYNTPNLFILTAAMVVMLYIGAMDDILNLSPKLRFIVQIATVLMLILVNGSSVNNLFGLWGVNEISIFIAVPLTIITAVGIINAINLIDGVNGLSSGFCILASTIFATIFYISGNTVMTILASTATGALIPFFLHNVFGSTTKMFIGDSGALVMGMLMSIFVINVLDTDSTCREFAEQGMSLVAFTLAVMSIPVFDTLRVMLTRLLQKCSPFHPDKTHLHHLFTKMGYSHVGTTISILTMNCLVILGCLLTYTLGASIDVQLYVVILLSLSMTFLFYFFMNRQIKKNTSIFRFVKRIGNILRIEKIGIWEIIEKNIDKV